MSSSNIRSHPEYSNSHEKWEPDRIRRILKDIKDTPKINLRSLLTALLARLQSDDQDVEASSSFTSVKVEQSKDIVEFMLRDATTFCDDTSSARATKLKKHLRDYRTQTLEKVRCASLSNALNTILSEYRNKRFGDLPVPSQRDEKEELVFLPNDLVALESKHIAKHSSRSKRRPDIIATYTSTLRDKYEGHGDAEFDDWVQIINDGKEINPSSGTLRWLDVHQPWEVIASGMDDADIPERSCPEIEKALLESKSHDRSNSTQSRNSRKRQSDEEFAGRSKKARVESEPKPKSFRQQVTDDKFDLLPDLRCAYYATERLSSAWYILHSTVIQLEDTKLSLRWYDAQGCFQSESIDIVDELPVFVVMLIIFQRFNKRMWGIDTETVESTDGTFQPDRETRCRFELIGRRTFASPAVRVAESGVENTKDEVPLFYKSSWVKCIDSKEPDTINIAHERANMLLPEKYRNMVTDHIPTVIASQVCIKQSTSTIRLLVRDVDESVQFEVEDIRKHARVRVWIVSRKLEPSEDLDAPTFWRIFWELLRCHYLLWKIGIAHRDISISNLMCTKRNGTVTGVLNDYDLAIVMDPGSRCPVSDGYERAGTTPFMALDLLDYREATLTRWYRHDLESFAWCLLWEMLHSPPSSWSIGSVERICESKRSFMYSVGEHIEDIRKEWMPYFYFTFTWFENMRVFSQCFDSKIVTSFLSTRKRRTDSEKIALIEAEYQTKEDKDLVRRILKSARKKSLGKDADVIRDASWISVKLLRT